MKKARVLIVDDHTLVRDGLRALLALVSDVVVVGEAANGKEAIKALEKTDYNLILMDVQMPEMDGFEATSVIRDPDSKILDHRIPIIAMTAHAMKGDERKCIEAGMDDYLAKPIDPQKLLEKIKLWGPR